MPLAAQPIGYIGDAYEAWYVSRMNLATFAWTGSVVDDDGFTGLAMSPAGELFGVQVVISESASGAVVTPWLARIDLESQTVEPRGQLALPGPSIYETGLAFDATGRLWLTTEGRLYEVDPTNGALRQQAELGREVFGLAGCGSTLFGITRPTELGFPVQVLRIDPATGAATELGPGTGPDVFMSDGGGLDFDFDGRLWGVLHNTSGIGLPVFLDFIVEFDTITGAVVRSEHLHELGRGLAIGPPPAVCPGRGVTEVPTLGEWGLVLLAGLLGGGALYRLRLGRPVVMLAAATLSLASPVGAQPIGYIGDAWDGFGIHRWNLATGQFVDTAVGAVAITGLAMSPSGELFGVSLEFTDTATGLEQRLWLAKVNLETQALELRGPLEPAAEFVEEVGLAFDATGRLWLGTPEGRLYQVDPDTGAATFRADLELPMYGLAGCGRTLYGLSDGEALADARLLRIDPDAGTVFPLALAGPEVGFARSGGLDFSADGRLWGVLHNRSAIPAPFLDFVVEFDPSSGAVLRWNQYDELGRGLAIGPPPAVCPGRGVTEVPTLGEWGLVLLAGLLGGGALWRLRGR